MDRLRQEAEISSKLKPYRYSGAASLVLLHEKHLKIFVTTWRQAKAHNVTVPRRARRTARNGDVDPGRGSGARRGRIDGRLPGKT